MQPDIFYIYYFSIHIGRLLIFYITSALSSFLHAFSLFLLSLCGHFTGLWCCEFSC